MWLVGTVAVLCAVTRVVLAEWECPKLSRRPAAECSCDLPFTIRCAGDHTALQIIGRHLREEKMINKDATVTLLDLSLRGVTALSEVSVSELEGLDLQGLVISSGDIRRIQQNAFRSVASSIVALGLPNNKLPSVPSEAIFNLTDLDRLDLSNNKIVKLEDNSFLGLLNLFYLDLSYNHIKSIAVETFEPLGKLTVLRLRGNSLTVSALYPLTEAQLLKGLDLSGNALSGPLGPTTIPFLNKLTTLQLADNTFDSIRRGCLSGSPNLNHLDLHNNQIDVLEDFAFMRLKNLKVLNLSQNDIVAVSGSSLAWLTKLEHLDLSQNFLRSLSAEPFKTLSGLKELFLHDNDISIVEEGALAEHMGLVRFTVEDNPLDCDCQIASFAKWLREAEEIPSEDKEFAVCATPPHLEGALLYQQSKSKLCDDLENGEPEKTKPSPTKNYLKPDSAIMNNPSFIDDLVYGTDIDIAETASFDYLSKNEEPDIDAFVGEGTTNAFDEENLPISDIKVKLTEAWYEGEEVHLCWSLEPPSNLTIKCAGISLSRAGEPAKHVACHNAEPCDIVLRGIKVDPTESYAFCIVLEQLDSKNNPVSLILGCSKSRMIREKVTFATIVPTESNIHHKSTADYSEWNEDKNEIQEIEMPVDKRTTALCENNTTELKNTISTVPFSSLATVISSEANIKDITTVTESDDNWYNEFEIKLPVEINTAAVSESTTAELETKMPTVSLHSTTELETEMPIVSLNSRTELETEMPTVSLHSTTELETEMPTVSLQSTTPRLFLENTELEVLFNSPKLDVLLDTEKPSAVFASKKISLGRLFNSISDRIPQDTLRISEIKSNQSKDGSLVIIVTVGDAPPDLSVSGLQSSNKFINCYVVLYIKTKGHLVAQRDTPCQKKIKIYMDGFFQGPYEICAKITKNNDYNSNLICVVPQQLADPILAAKTQNGIKGLNTVLICAVLVTIGLLVALALFIRRIIKKPTIYVPSEHFIYYSQAAKAEEPKSYVMLSPAKT